MAERRMFTKKITESDAFLDMPMSTQALYFHLNMEADDDGFVNNPKKVQRMVGASADDLNLLLAKNFIINFDSGVIVIKHWRMHNLIRTDRYHPTVYTSEKEMLQMKDNKAYTLINSELHTACLPNGNQTETEVRLGKERLVEDRSGLKDSCSELPGEPSEPKPKKEKEPELLADVEAIPLNNGTEYRLPLSEYEEYVRLYPNVDIKQEFRNMRGWSLKNKARRKTPRGVGRFINGWLAREQDRGGRYAFSGNGNRIAGSTGTGKETLTDFAQRAKEWAENG